MSGDMEQPVVANLSPHFRVTWRPIEDDIELVRRASRQHCLNDRFRLQKIVAEEFCRRDIELSVFELDRLFLLTFARPLALLIHELFEPRHIDSQAMLATHQLSEIERET